MKLNLKKYEVSVEKLRWRCDPATLGVKTSNDVKVSKEIIGQERALRSLRLGLEMKHPGYNVFVTGYSGTGRMTTIKLLLAEFEKKQIPLRDRCYVYNFKDPDQPTLITLPAGRGRKFQHDMEELLANLKKDIPSLFESKRFQEERKKVIQHFQDRQKTILKDFEKKVKEKGFEVIQVQIGASVRPDIAPMVNNQPVGLDHLEKLVSEGKMTREQVETLMNERMRLEDSLELLMREMRNIDRKAKESLDELTQSILRPVVEEAVEEVKSKYRNEKLSNFLDAVTEHVMSTIYRFHRQEEPQEAEEKNEEKDYLEFRVNVLVDNSATKGVPIIIETNPKYKNLFGTIEREVDRNGVWRTDFTLIKAGSLLRADGGYLVLNALDALIEPGVWQTLKRTLRNGLLEIQPPESGILGASSALKPEPIDLDVKVVMIGDAEIYYLLYEQDDDFKKIFKVRADFDVEMPKEKESIRSYISFIRMICDDEKLTPFDNTGIAAVIEYGIRLSGHQKKLSTRFNLIADVLREANFWASKDSSPLVTEKHVRKAIEERIKRVDLLEEKIQERILEGAIMIDTSGKVVGQVNGLSVYDLGDHSFGKPSRITARTAMGRQGVINIERDAELSGPTHNKGVLILSGYLRSMYAHNKPLVMSTSIAFEQSYGGVDGDSASSTEVYAILSSLSEIPLRQDIAVTGSINQKGEIQPIGGVNQKIEGFFDVCKARGLTGTQGVLIPHQNVTDLMLRQDVVDAVKKGKFHIYAIETVDQGIEILTGIPAGKRKRDGTFEKGSLHFYVDRKLTEYAKRWKELEEE
jgi:lon-related putative ATP-dependent protease